MICVFSWDFVMDVPAIDLTADLRQAIALAVSESSVDRLLQEALGAFQPVVPYDLAAVMLLEAKVSGWTA